MEFAIVDLPCVGILVNVGVKNPNLVGLGYCNRYVSGDNDPVNILRRSISLEPALFLSTSNAIVEDCLLYTSDAADE